MKKWKRPIVLLLAFAGVGLLLWGTHQFFPLPFVKVNAFRAVPKYSSFVFSPGSFRSTSSPWDAWELPRHWALLGDVEATLADTIGDAPSFRRAVAVLQPMGKGRMGWLGIWDTPGTEEKLLRWLAANPAEPSRFKQVPIYSGKTAEGQPFAIARFHNLILAAPFPFLIEDAIRQLKSFSLDRAPASKKTGPILLQPSQVALQWTTVLSDQGRAVWDLFRSWKGWVDLNVETDSSGWRATGHWRTGRDSTWMDQLKAASPTSPDGLFAVLPEQLLAFFWAPPAPGDWWEAGAARRFLKPWWNGEWAVGLLPGYGVDAQPPAFWVGKIRSQEDFDGWLAEWTTEQGELPSFPYQNFSIRQILAEPLLPTPWSDEPLPLRNPFLVQIDDYLVITDSRPSLEVWLDQYIAGQVLARADHFLEARSKLPSTALGWAYVEADRLGPVLAKSFEPAQELPFLKKGQMQVAFLPGEDHLRVEAVKRSAEVFSSAISIAWKANLDTVAITAPQPVFGGAERSWMVQDARYELYRIAPGGKVLWKRPLGSPLLSDIYPIAYYTDAPTELLFNTRDAIFIVDAKGELVSTFPLRLQSAATNGLLLTDFSGDGDYGIFLACENGRLYGFDRYGRPLVGWGPGQEVGRVVKPLQHFQYQNKDYLLAWSEDGFLHVFQRDGSYRFPPIQVIGNVLSAPGTQVLPQMARIAISDGYGSVQIINGEGQGFVLNTPVGNNQRVLFRFEDVVGDDRKDYLVMSGPDIAVYYYTGDKVVLWKKWQLPQPQDELVAGTVPGEEKAFFGTIDRQRRQVFLFTPEGKIYPGFPLAGTSAFSIVRIPQGRLLVTALDSDVYAYLLAE
ncbi:MAG: hypothetical protein H6563_15220 [Lewinellaceae bacterium]|nr:hypothetical protein [Lewinellaceae bacterium]